MKSLPVSVLALLVCLASSAQVGPGAPVAQTSPPGSVQLLESGQLQEALAASDQALAKNPADLDQLVVKIQALARLGRGMEALRLAVPAAGQHPERPELRFLAGRCAFGLGMVPQAVQVWSALFTCADASWAQRAYVAAAQAQLAVGKEAAAAKLVADALARWPAPGQALVDLALALNPDPVSQLKLLGTVAAVDPARAATWEEARQIVASAAGPLFAEGPAEGTVTIPLKEKSERVDVPVQDVTASPAGGVKDTTTLFSGSRVSVPVAVGDKKEWMLLDSGAEGVLLTSAYAKALGLKVVSATEYMGLGYQGAMKSSWVVVPSMKVGGIEFRNVPAMIMDKDTDFWKEIGGILPLWLFRHHAVLYDRRHEKLVLYPSGTAPGQVLGDKLFPQRSLWLGSRPFLMADVKEASNLPFLLDTGADVTYVAAEYAKPLGITVNTGKYSSQASRGLSGTFSSGVAEQVEIRLGDGRFQLPRALVTEVGLGGPLPCYGILGRDVLDKFQVFVDYPANVLVFKAYDR